MTDIDVSAAERKCVRCGDPTERPPAFIHGGRKVLSESGGTYTLRRFPPILLCPEHHEEFKVDRLMVGWCEECWAWGELFAVSPCGAPFALWPW
jgi:hypothetical protein